METTSPLTMSAAQLQAAVRPVVSQTVPIAGGTVAFATNASDQTILVKPAGLLATLTLTLPSEASSALGQIVRFATTQVLTALTTNGAASILNAVSTLAAGGSIGYQKVDTDTWVRI